MLEIAAFDDVEAEELLLRFCERAVDHEVLAAFAQRGRSGGRHQSRNGTEPALVRQLLADRCEATQHRIVLLFGPAAHDVFGVITEYGVQHGVTSVAEE